MPGNTLLQCRLSLAGTAQVMLEKDLQCIVGNNVHITATSQGLGEEEAVCMLDIQSNIQHAHSILCWSPAASTGTEV